MSRIAPVLALALVAGCDPDPTKVDEDDVVVLTSCADSGSTPCDLVADAHSRFTVVLCLGESTAVRKDSLVVDVELSSGSWWLGDDDDDARLQVDLTVDPCVDLQVVPAHDDHQARIDAHFSGYGDTVWVDLQPADIDDALLLDATPRELPDGGGATHLTVTAMAAGGGTLSAGTRVTWEVLDDGDTGTPDASATVWPSSMLLADDGRASAQLLTAAGLPSATVQVTVSPPDWPDSTVDSVSESLTLYASASE